MASLIHQRCFNHALREAAARCPECARFYCRECIAEHKGRVICASCLARIVRPKLTERAGFIYLVRSVQLMFGVATACLFFYFAGRALLSVDSSVHEGTIWRKRQVQSQ